MSTSGVELGRRQWRGRKVSSSSDEKTVKSFQVLFRNCLYSFPLQSNTNRLSDLTAHRLVKGERSSTLTEGLSFDMQLKNNRKKSSFSPLFACQSLTPVAEENCSLLDQVSWDDLQFKPSPNALAAHTRSFVRALWPGCNIGPSDSPNQLTPSFVSH